MFLIRHLHPLALLRDGVEHDDPKTKRCCEKERGALGKLIGQKTKIRKSPHKETVRRESSIPERLDRLGA